MKKLLLSLTLVATGSMQAGYNQSRAIQDNEVVPQANLSQGAKVVCPKQTEVCFRAQSPVKVVQVKKLPQGQIAEHMIFKRQPNYQLCPEGTDICVQSNTQLRTAERSEVHQNFGGTCKAPAEEIHD